MRIADDIGDLDGTQAQELGSKRHKDGNAAKDLFNQLRHDASARDQRMAERVAAMPRCRGPGRQGCSNGDDTGKSDEEFFRVGGHQIKHLSNSLDGKMVALEQRVQERWKSFEVKWSLKVVHLDDREAVICIAEFRIRRAVQQDEEQWKRRMANEDKITTNAIETLRSDFNKKSAKMRLSP